MKKIILLISLFLSILNANSQSNLPFSVELIPSGLDAKFTLKQDISTENVIISINIKGDIEISVMDEAEIEYYWLQSEVSGKIDKVDKVNFEYYYDATNAGKIKKIGNLLFTYYDFHEQESKVGKIKSIGNYTFDFFDFMEDESIIGKISKINNIPIAYHFGFENSGKIQQIGNIRINYNTDFDENINAGKIIGIVGSQAGVLIKTSIFSQGQ